MSNTKAPIGKAHATHTSELHGARIQEWQSGKSVSQGELGEVDLHRPLRIFCLKTELGGITLEITETKSDSIPCLQGA